VGCEWVKTRNFVNFGRASDYYESQGECTIHSHIMNLMEQDGFWIGVPEMKAGQNKRIDKDGFYEVSRYRKEKPAGTTWKGTCHFQCVTNAEAYYVSQEYYEGYATELLNRGEICLGLPPLKRGQKVKVGDYGQYHVSMD
jgi:hypothetical protein